MLGTKCRRDGKRREMASGEIGPAWSPSAYRPFRPANWVLRSHHGTLGRRFDSGSAVYTVVPIWEVDPDSSSLTPQCLVSLCRRMDFARSRPDTGIGDRGSGAALLSVPAGTAARRDRHGTHSRLPAWHGNGGKGVCRGFQGVFLFGGGLLELVAGVAGAGCY